MWATSFLTIVLAISWFVYPLIAFGQEVVFTSQCNNFASNATITPAQAKAAGVDSVTANNIAVALDYERSNWAHGSVDDDPFYQVPPDSADTPAGTLLKAELDANTSLYTLPPNTALSRIIFQTKTLNGTLAPASAFVLWPYTPRTQSDGSYQVVAWGHGNSRSFANCAPSQYRYLLYQFAAPYTLALQGYVDVAPDFIGLGVNKDATGKPIRTALAANPSIANDLLYSVQAAQFGFASLSKQFVVMGHSEGGGGAWAAAESQAVHPVAGYLGSIAASPLTDIVAIANFYGSIADSGVIPLIPGLESVFPSFKASDFLTPLGIARLDLLASIQGCNAVTTAGILAGTGLVNPNWTETYYAKSYENLTAVGSKKIAGPVLVLQGELDIAVPFPITSAAVNKTCTAYPDSKIEFLTFANVTHVPVLYASQQIWLDWIADRFNGVRVEAGCQMHRYSSARPYQYYQPETNWFIEYATEAYETA